MWPNFRHIEDIPTIVFGLCGIHNLYKDIPNRVVFFLNGFKHVSNHVIWVFTCNFGGFFSTEVLDSLSGFHVNFDIFERTVLVP